MVRASLRTRMVAALTLSVLGYGALVWLVVWLLPTRLAVLVGCVLVAVLAVMVHGADRIAYLLTNAVAIDHDQHPTAYRTLHGLAQQVGIATPALAVIPTDEPNAVTAGRSDRAVVCVTLGLLKRLDDDELEAVLAHEVAHIANGDSAVMTIASFPATVGTVLLSLSRRSFGWKAFVLGYLFVPLYLALLSLPLLVASLPGTVVLSRSREYAADRAGAALTGDPTTLALALGTLHGAQRPPETDLRRIAGLSAFAIVPPAESLLPLSLHPPTAERIRRLKAMAAE